MPSVIMSGVIMPGVVAPKLNFKMLCVAPYHVQTNVIIFTFIFMLSVIMPNVIILGVFAPILKP